MTDSDIARRRLQHQSIAPASAGTAADVVRRLGAVQAQDYAGATWALGLRLHAATRQTIEQAFLDREIVRTWPMRGTLHFVASEDARWMLALLTPRILAGSARRHRQLELDEATLARAGDLFIAALEGGRRLTRSALMQTLEQGGIAVAGQRGYHILWWTAQNGLICFGPRQGKQDTFVLLDEWLPPQKPLGREAALAELAGRYFGGHGPATLHDFAWWSGLRMADARAALAMVETTLDHTEHDGQTYWFSDPPSAPPTAPPAAHLLPGFDEYLLGYRDRRAVLDPAHAGKVVPGGNGIFKPIIVVEGRVVGTWARILRRAKVVVTVSPFEDLGRSATAAARAAAEPYGRFLDLPVEFGG
jgi:hypothetical protein